jgi:hypothetical protein
VTRLQNAPTGWRAFREFRESPAPMFRRQHGNRKHGRYSKQGIADMRVLRLCVRMLRAGLWNMPVPGLTRRIAPGWIAYRMARSNRFGEMWSVDVARNAEAQSARGDGT